MINNNETNVKSKLARKICEILLRETNEVIDRSRAPVNTAMFRALLRDRVGMHLNDLHNSSLQLTEYVVICDEINNPPNIVENGDFRLVIHWKEDFYHDFRIEIGKEGILFRPEFDEDESPYKANRKEKDNEAKGILF